MKCIYCYGEFKYGLHLEEIKELFKERFNKKWKSKYNKFFKWMRGQTIEVSKYADCSLIYRSDVKRWLDLEIEGIPTYFD